VLHPMLNQRRLTGLGLELGRLDRLVVALVKAWRVAENPPANAVHDVFSNIGDYQWLFLNTIGYRRMGFLRQLLPSMPDADVQARYVGKSGDPALLQAFDAYHLFKDLAAQHGHPIQSTSSVLDFGCGWGRILRFFMRDVAPANLVGVDCMPKAIELCRQTNTVNEFKQVPLLPPSDLQNNSFDLIYLFSVFSHLSEDAHDRWLTEFRRVMKPGGILIATTWPRSFIKARRRVAIPT
jgi:2-polyprenyl-3-methyl-5-hydroxy-6-metoxy-1,4-benzoquinol methylase